MYFEDIAFRENIPVSASVLQIGAYPLHAHRGVLEILLVLRGSLAVKVGFENFKLKEGDYVVINAEDSHQMIGETENTVALLYFDLEKFETTYEYIRTVLFACESFDLAKYKKQETFVREKLYHLFRLALSRKSEYAAELMDSADDLLLLLIREYAMESYYNRNGLVSEAKKEKYDRMFQSICEGYYRKNLQEMISEKEHYSKSYLSHLFKEVGNSSFADVLGYVRSAKSEPLLLDTNLSITEISEKCGFSDVKYYNRTFTNWFGQTPFEYRRTYRREISAAADYCVIEPNAAVSLFSELDDPIGPGSAYQISINPLSLKTIGTRSDLLQTVEQPKGYSPQFVWKKEFENENCVMIPAVNDAGKDGKKTGGLVASYIKSGLKPCICFPYGRMTKAEIKKAARKWKTALLKDSLFTGIEEMEFWILYTDPGESGTANALASELKRVLGPGVRTMLIAAQSNLL